MGYCVVSVWIRISNPKLGIKFDIIHTVIGEFLVESYDLRQSVNLPTVLFNKQTAKNLTKILFYKLILLIYSSINP